MLRLGTVLMVTTLFAACAADTFKTEDAGGDAGAADATADAATDEGHDGGDARMSPPEGGIRGCGPQTCDPSTEVCCAAAADQGTLRGIFGPNSRCTTPADCKAPSVIAECDDTQDCLSRTQADSGACCIRLGDAGGQDIITSIRCVMVGACDNTQRADVLCGPLENVCSAPQKCKASAFAPYYDYFICE